MDSITESMKFSDIPKDLIMVLEDFHAEITKGYDNTEKDAIAASFFRELVTHACYMQPETRDFLSTHSLDVIHVGNSLNIMVQNTSTRFSQVISIAKSSMSSSLAEEQKSNLVQQGVCGQKIYINEKHNVSLVKYYPRGSVNCLYENVVMPDELRYESCAFYISKMANALIILQQNEIFFSDAKITNWILDEDPKDGDLKPIIVDDKSLCHFSLTKLPGAEKYFLRTHGYWPPDVKCPLDDNKISLIHAYILGANIYDFLTGREPPAYGIHESDFRYKIFSGETGERYKQLIMNLTNPDSSKRMTLEQGAALLAEISLQYGNPTSEIVHDTAEENMEQPSTIGSSISSTEQASYKSGSNYTKRIVTSDDFEEESFIIHKSEYRGLSGEALKREILKELQIQINKVENENDLQELSAKIKGTVNIAPSAEFRILSQRQGSSQVMFKEPKYTSEIDIMLDRKLQELHNKGIKPNENI